jgi:threo-3-hydroxy-L-aspartate ammonia-lyase
MLKDTLRMPAPLQAVIRPTTIIDSPRLNSKLGLEVTLASETFQVTGSFKFRAAYNLASTVEQNRIITASSGNFGQAMAYACKLLGKQCTVVMPDNSATVKVEAVKEFGGIVDLVETSKKSRAQRVKELAEADPDAYVASAYDDPLVIEGNATLGKELAKLNFDAVLAPVGGGGLSSGLIRGLQSAGSNTKVFGVEPQLANDASRSLKADSIQVWDAEPQTIADGARTLSIGKHNWEVLRQGMQEILEVSEESIITALRTLFSHANLKCEPTGAVSVAALLEYPLKFQKLKVCCVVSGGNVDPAVFKKLVFDQ